MIYGPSHSTGYAFLMPGDQLAQGSAPPLDAHPPFDVIVFSAMEYQPDFPGYIVMHVPLDDGPPPSGATRRRIRSAAREIAEHIRAGRRVLCTCWQGRNRSGVLAGLALVELGLPAHRAVRRIRNYRNGLTNRYFREMVEGML